MQTNQYRGDKSKKKHPVQAMIDYLVSGGENDERVKLIARLRELKAHIASAASPEQIHRLLSQYAELSVGVNLPIDLEVETVKAVAESKINFFHALMEANIILPQKSEVLNILYATLEVIAINEKKCADLDKEHKEILEFADNFIRQYQEDPKQFTKQQLAEAVPILKQAVDVRRKKDNLYLDSHQNLTQALETIENSSEKRNLRDCCIFVLSTELKRVGSDRQSNLEHISVAITIVQDISGPDKEKFTSHVVHQQREIEQKNRETQQEQKDVQNNQVDIQNNQVDIQNNQVDIQNNQVDIQNNQRDAQRRQLKQDELRKLAERIAKNSTLTKIPTGPVLTPSSNISQNHSKSK